MNVNKASALQGHLAIETGAFFTVVGGAKLTLLPGTLRCIVELRGHHRCSACAAAGRCSPGHEVYDPLDLRLVLADSQGRAYALERSINPWSIARLAALESPTDVPSAAVPLMLGIHGYCDRRRYLAVVSTDAEGHAAPFAYFEESLQPEIDLLKFGKLPDADDLIVRINATPGGGVGSTPTPEVVFRTALLPWLALLERYPCSDVPPSYVTPTFAPLDREAPSNRTVLLREQV